MRLVGVRYEWNRIKSGGGGGGKKREKERKIHMKRRGKYEKNQFLNYICTTAADFSWFFNQIQNSHEKISASRINYS